ncbi:flp pilus assembly protein tadB [Vibrio ishigakensis]|uniref:Flp pilus assembly protein tadB n=1 Tax=Vibrio ishigakensis TaxID=1481914 RepID=A0A0B8P2L7_9VIBR|nr:flp pilus assembly protein tadB [Vibrio ishigakensis]
MNIWLALIPLLFGLGLLVYAKRRPDPRYMFLEQVSEAKSKELYAVDLKGLTKSNFLQGLTNFWNVLKASLGKFPISKTIVFIALVNGVVFYVNQRWLNFPELEVHVSTTILFLFFGVRFLVDRRRKAFDNDFPDALNILMSAVTAGESINSAFSYVAKVSDTDVGREFKDISDRMRWVNLWKVFSSVHVNDFHTLHFYFLSLLFALIWSVEDNLKVY